MAILPLCVSFVAVPSLTNKSDTKKTISGGINMAGQEKNCYLGINGKKHGPLSEQDIQELYDQNKINDSTQFYRKGMKAWVKLSDSGIIEDGIPDLDDDDDYEEAPARRTMSKKPFIALAFLPLVVVAIFLSINLFSSTGDAPDPASRTTPIIETPTNTPTQNTPTQSPSTLQGTVRTQNDIADKIVISDIRFDGYAVVMVVENKTDRILGEYGGAPPVLRLELYDSGGVLIEDMIVASASGDAPGSRVRITTHIGISEKRDAVTGRIVLLDNDERTSSEQWQLVISNDEIRFANTVPPAPSTPAPEQRDDPNRPLDVSDLLVLSDFAIDGNRLTATMLNNTNEPLNLHMQDQINLTRMFSLYLFDANGRFVGTGPVMGMSEQRGAIQVGESGTIVWRLGTLDMSGVANGIVTFYEQSANQVEGTELTSPRWSLDFTGDRPVLGS